MPKACEKLRAENLSAQGIVVQVKTNRFKLNQQYFSDSICTRLVSPCDYTPELIKHGLSLLKQIFNPSLKYKKLGVYMTDITPKAAIMTNLYETIDDSKKDTLMQTIDHLNKLVGKVCFSAQYEKSGNHFAKRDQVSPCYTTRWEHLPKAY
jgi:DNA polymerase V